MATSHTETESTHSKDRMLFCHLVAMDTDENNASAGRERKAER